MGARVLHWFRDLAVMISEYLGVQSAMPWTKSERPAVPGSVGSTSFLEQGST